MAKKLSVIEARSVELSNSVKAIGVEIHNHLCDIMKDIAKNRNTGVAAHFLSLLVANDKEGNSRSVVRADAVKAWLEAFAFCRFGSKDGKLTDKLNGAALESVLDVKAMADHVKTAKANPWNVFTKAKPFVNFDLLAIIKGAVDRADLREKATKTGELKIPEGAKADNIPADVLAKLRELIAE